MPKKSRTSKARKCKQKTQEKEIYETDAATIEKYRSVDRITSINMPTELNQHIKTEVYRSKSTSLFRTDEMTDQSQISDEENKLMTENVPEVSSPTFQSSNVLSTAIIKKEPLETNSLHALQTPKDNFLSNIQSESMSFAISTDSSISASEKYDESCKPVSSSTSPLSNVSLLNNIKKESQETNSLHASQTPKDNSLSNSQSESLSLAISSDSSLSASKTYDENCKRKNSEALPALPISKRIKTEPMDMLYESEISLETNNVTCEDSTAQSKVSINTPTNIDGNFQQKIKQEQLGEDSNSNLIKIFPEYPECIMIEKPPKKYVIIDLTNETPDVSTTCAQTFNSADKFYKNEKSTDKSYSFPKPKVTVKTEQDTISVTSINRDLPSTVSNNVIDHLSAQHTHVRNQEYSTTVVSVFEKSINSNHNNDVQMYSENSDEECSEKESVWSNSIFSDECIITESLPVSKVNEKEYQSSQMDSSDGRPYHYQFPTPLLGYIRKHIILDMAKVSEMKPLINKLKIENKRRNKERLQEKPETELGLTFETLYFLERSESPIIDYEEESPDQESSDDQVAENSTLNKLMNITNLPSYSSGMEEMGKPGLKNVSLDSKKVDQIHLVDSDQSDEFQNIRNTSLTIGVPGRSSDLNSMSRLGSPMEIDVPSVESHQENDSIKISSLSSKSSPIGCVNSPISKLALLKIINNVKETDSSIDKSIMNEQTADSLYGLSSVKNLSEFPSEKIKYNAETLHSDLSNENFLNRNNTNVRSSISHSASVQGDIFQTPLKRMKPSPKMDDVPINKDSKVKKLNLEEYRKKNRLNLHDPRIRTRQLSTEDSLSPPVSSPYFISNNLPTDSPTGSYSPSITPNYPVSARTMYIPLNTCLSDDAQGFSPTSNSSPRNFDISKNFDYPQNTNPTFKSYSYSPVITTNYSRTLNSVTAFTSNDPSQNYPTAGPLIAEDIDYRKSISTLSHYHNVYPINAAQNVCGTEVLDSNASISSTLVSSPQVTTNYAQSCHATTGMTINQLLSNRNSEKELFKPINTLRTGDKFAPLNPTSQNVRFCSQQFSNSEPSNKSVTSRKTLLPTPRVSNTSHLHIQTSKPDLNFVCLLPPNLKFDIGEHYIHTNDVYFIIIEWNINSILSLNNKTIPDIKFSHVRNIYDNPLQYYNTYFPLLLLECWAKIYIALKARDRKDRFDFYFKILNYEQKQTYVSITCDSVIRTSDLDNIPKDGNIILVQFASRPNGNVKMLGYVYFSAARAFSPKHDRHHETMKFLSTNDHKKLTKIKISFYIVFSGNSIDEQKPIQIAKLTSIKKTLVQNDALIGLSKSCLCNNVLDPLANGVRAITLPKRQDKVEMRVVIQQITQSMNSAIPQMVVLRATPFTDSHLAVVHLVNMIQETNTSAKILVCVKQESINPIGRNLLQSCKNLIVINRDRESLHKELEGRNFDLVWNLLKNETGLPEVEAKAHVLRESNMILAVTRACFYEDIQSFTKDLMYCIMHDAHSFTEPESVLPLMYGIRHVFLIGNPEEACVVRSKAAIGYDYNKSLFHRIYSVT
ncbi:uncharacterized protein NPIL_181681 [Nephila pilipes]|uniref:Uncharacterized protein n=1 Tax=Nephila pilipes TaxID=299642 RepID=A0A8X6PI79_NEPPI|nr:uncharacterized protein NPIL_181681 [Nephila pilipes]